MKRQTILIITFFIFSAGKSIAQSRDTTPGRLLYIVDSLYTAQNKPFMDAMEGKMKPDSAQKLTLEIYASNCAWLKQFVDRFGYPGYKKLGENYSASFNEMIFNCNNDIGLQEKVFTLFKNESNLDTSLRSEKNYLRSLGFFSDKLQIAKGKKQIYGTQLQVNEKTGLFEAQPLEDPAGLNARRAAMKLEPMEEYLKNSNAALLKMRNNK
jgi:hypothetical protein